MTNFFKRISSVAMAAAMATTMVVSASANDMNIDDFDAMPNVSGERIAYNAEGTQIILYPGEVLVGDTIVGEKITSSPNLPSVSTLSATDDCPNYATSTEYIQLWYTGYIQFRASYLTKEGDGSGLKPNRHVKQGWIDYERQNTSVIGGKKYTEVARDKYDDTIYSQSASCMDDLLDWSENGRTIFCRGWDYFA